jgi:hypothetical protein
VPGTENRVKGNKSVDTILRGKGMKKAELYQQIAAKHTPADVIPVPVAAQHRKHFHGLAYVDEDYDDEGNELPRRMEVPLPVNTMRRLFTYLHECVHMRLRHRALVGDNDSYVRNEEEADREALRILKEEGITVPRHVLLRREKVMMRERDYGTKRP